VAVSSGSAAVPRQHRAALPAPGPTKCSSKWTQTRQEPPRKKQN